MRVVPVAAEVVNEVKWDFNSSPSSDGSSPHTVVLHTHSGQPTHSPAQLEECSSYCSRGVFYILWCEAVESQVFLYNSI